MPLTARANTPTHIAHNAVGDDPHKIADLRVTQLRLHEKSIAELVALWVTAWDRADDAFRQLALAEQAADDMRRRWPTSSALEARFGIPRLNTTADDLSWIAQEISDEIIRRQPATADDAALKYGVLLKQCGDGWGGIDNAAPLRAFLDDLARLALNRAA